MEKKDLLKIGDILIEEYCDSCGGTGKCPYSPPERGWHRDCGRCKGKGKFPNDHGKALLEFLESHVTVSSSTLKIE